MKIPRLRTVLIFAIAATLTGACGRLWSSVDLDLHFNEGVGYVAFQAEGPGAAGGTVALGFKDDRVTLEQGLTIDSKGRYVVVARSRTASGSRALAIYRYLPTGEIDTSFAGQGYAVFQDGGNGATGLAEAGKFDVPYSVVEDSQGRYLVVGQSSNPTGGSSLVVWCYDSSGELCDDFGSGTGYSIVPDPTTGFAGGTGGGMSDSLLSVVIDSEDRIILGGSSRNGTNARAEVTIARLDPDGSLDTTFNSGQGYVLFQPGGNGVTGEADAAKWDQTNAIRIDREGNYVIAGKCLDSSGGYAMCVLRYTSDGDLDTSFATTGYTVFQLGGAGAAGATGSDKDEGAASIAIDSQNRIVLAGPGTNGLGASTSAGIEPVVWRYNSDGTPDTNFGDGGYYVFNHLGAGRSGGTSATKVEWAAAVRIDAEDRIVVSGYTASNVAPTNGTIWRLLDDGTPDSSFGEEGTLVFENDGVAAGGGTGAFKGDVFYSLQIDHRNRYVVAGRTLTATGYFTVGIWRFLDTGEINL